MAQVRCQLANKMKNENYDPLNGIDLRSRLSSLPNNNLEQIKREYSPKT